MDPHTGPGKALNVLVVENHADTRRGMQMFLQTLGHRASGAESIAVALALAGRTRFDLLMSDILLPDGDGWELLARLEAAGCRPPRAVAMSGLGYPGDLARSRAAGFELHLIKPFKPEELVPMLRRAESAQRLPSDADSPTTPAVPSDAATPGAELAQRMHDGLCQQLAAAALLQQALLMRLEKTASPETVADARYVGDLLDDAITETRHLMRDLRRES